MKIGGVAIVIRFWLFVESRTSLLEQSTGKSIMSCLTRQINRLGCKDATDR